MKNTEESTWETGAVTPTEMSDLMLMDDVMLHELRDVYDGWSVEELPDGTMLNRWNEGTWRHAKTQEYIDRLKEEFKNS